MGILFREGTWDRTIWEDVADRNEYLLPRPFSADEVILDIGAHIGSFSYACLDRGVGKVIACEPCPDNFRILCHNLHGACKATDRFIPIYGAAWRNETFGSTVPMDTRSRGANTGGAGVLGRKEYQQPSEGVFPVAAIPFDALVDIALSCSASSQIRLVKLDCEGSEWPILFTSMRFHRIVAFCGEYHCIKEEDIPENSFVNGWTSGGYGAEKIQKIFADNGYETVVSPSPVDGRLGKFFAWKAATFAL